MPVRKKTRHWYLPLDKYEGFLKQWILEENKHWKTNVYGQCKSWLDGGLEARAVTRDLDWGIPVPIDGQSRSSTDSLAPGRGWGERGYNPEAHTLALTHNEGVARDWAKSPSPSGRRLHGCGR